MEGGQISLHELVSPEPPYGPTGVRNGRTQPSTMTAQRAKANGDHDSALLDGVGDSAPPGSMEAASAGRGYSANCAKSWGPSAAQRRPITHHDVK